MAILFSVIALVFFQFTVWTVRERYQSSEASAVTPPFAIILQTLRNRVFLKYMAIFFLFNLGYLAVQRVLPYWVKVGLGGSPGMVSALMAQYNPHTHEAPADGGTTSGPSTQFTPDNIRTTLIAVQE